MVEVSKRAREAAATVFDRIARNSRNTDVADLNRSYARKIRAGEGDDFDAVQSAMIALTDTKTETAMLREALGPFAAFASNFDKGGKPGKRPVAADYRRAREVLTGSKSA